MSDTRTNDGIDSGISERLIRYRHLLPPMSAALRARLVGEDDPEETTQDGVPIADDEAVIWPPLSDEAALDRAVGCLLGLAAADAVAAGSIDSWTGRTSAALCLAETLLASGTVDLEDLMLRLQGCIEQGENTSDGTCLGVDETTLAAVRLFADPTLDGIAADDADQAFQPPVSDDGSLVRIAPLAIFGARDPDLAEALAARQSRATHPGTEAVDACRLLVAILGDALRGADKDAATRQRVMALCPQILFISAGEWRAKTRDQLRLDGSAVGTFDAALWCVWQTDNFEAAVTLAAEFGGSAGGTGAVVGQIAGALYGASAVPAKWLDRLADRDRIELMAVALREREIADE